MIEQLWCGDVQDAGVAIRVLIDTPAQHGLRHKRLALAGLVDARVDRGVEGDHGGAVEGCRESVDVGLKLLELGGGVLGDDRFLVVAQADENLAIGQVALAGRVLGRGRDDNGGRRDAEAETDGGERGPGSRLVAGQVSQGEPHGDRQSFRGGRERSDGEGADEEEADHDRHGAADEKQRVDLVLGGVDARRKASEAGTEQDHRGNR